MDATANRRRLTVILSADVAGYSRLMGEDEEGTLKTLSACRTSIEGCVSTHNGRIVSTAGDSVLAEFPSTIDAVRCALDMQDGIAACNEGLPESRRMEFRMGINLGDVIVEGNDIFGDGVNVAARLQAAAAPGSIAVASAVYEQVRHKLPLGFTDLGEQRFKNIAEPVRVYRLERDGAPRQAADGGAAHAAADKSAAEKPSIAVLPFQNMSGDAEQEYFVDGIVEDVITELSRYPDLFVIARNSTFTYKGRAVDIKQVGRELGVRYVVEGSVRKAGNRVRITVQLIEAEKGYHLWAERYERDLADVFAVQDEITQMIVAGLPGRVEAAQMALAKRKPPQAMAAYDYLLRAKDHHHRRTKEDNAKALEMAERAIALDPEYAQAHAWRACIIGQAWANGYGVTVQELSARAEELSRTLERLSADEFECHRLLAAINLYFFRRYEQAMLHQERAYALVPNDPRVVSQQGEMLIYLGRPEEAIGWIERAMRLDPSEADRRAAYLAQAQFCARRYEEAIRTYRRVARLGAQHHAYLAAAHAMLGRDAEAASHAAEAVRLDPAFTIAGALAFSPFMREEDVAHLREACLKAGLPAGGG
ncbi:MAG: adenylate/guanylate cyclase domain-containing protein [Alphaproteobacteria bacterium]